MVRKGYYIHKRLAALPLFVLICGAVSAAPPDCQVSYHFTNRVGDLAKAGQILVASVPATGPAYNNIVSNCQAWSMTYDSEGFSGVSLSFESAPNLVTSLISSPGTFITFAGSTVSGTNPNTATTSGFFNGTGYYPWIRANLTTATGTGSINVVLSGWKSVAYLSANSSGGGGAVATVSATVPLASSGGANPAISVNNFQGNNAVVQYAGAAATASTCAQFDANLNLISSAGSCGVPPYDATITAQTTTTVTTVTHGQGTAVAAFCFDNSTPANAQSCDYSVASNGDVVFTWSPAFTGKIRIIGGGGTSFTATTVIHSIGTTFDGAGSALTIGTKSYVTIPYACTIQAWNMTLDAGTATIDIWKIATGTAIPTVANTITAAALPAIATGTAIHSTTLSGWTTTVTANDIFGFNISAVATATKASLVLQCQ